MRFAVLADAHIGRSIPLAIAEHRRRAFNTAFAKTVDAIIDAGVDYVFLCGDLFERRTLRPHLVQFAHDELYRLVEQTKQSHGKQPKILIIRGNHDGRPQSDTLDYIKHPLADYLHAFDDDEITYRDENLTVVGLNYYDQIDRAFDELARPALMDAEGTVILMLHGFVHGYNQVPPYSASVTVDQLSEASPDYVFAGHYHRCCPPRRLPSGGWLLTPGSLEMYDFAENPEKGFYVVDTDPEPKFTWVPIESMHMMKQATVESSRRRAPDWYSDRILEEVESFRKALAESGKEGYLRIRVQGLLEGGYPGDIDLTPVSALIEGDPLLLWVDIDTLRLELPLTAGVPEREVIDLREFFSDFGGFADEVGSMHARVREVLEEEASLQTGLLTPSSRAPLVKEWVERFEKVSFTGEEK
jgi:DNA repair exonuclease SbcCD nuclease subunit